MTDAFKVIKFAALDFWDEFVLLVLMNLLWTLAAVLPSLPFFLLRQTSLVLVLALGLLLLLPLPIVSAALCYVTNQIARGKGAGWRSFGQGIRRYWGKGLIVGVVSLIVVVLLAVNLQFYAAILEGTLLLIVLAVWVVMGLYWLLMQVFWFPMMLELESEKLLMALRNALMMVVVTPGFTLTLGVILVLVIVLSVLLWVPVVLLTTSFVLLICNHATRSRLAFAQKVPYEPGAKLG